MSTKRRRIKKRQLKEDQFVTTTFQIAGFLRRHRTQALLAGAGGVFLIVVVILLVTFQLASRKKAQEQLGVGIGMYQVGQYEEAASRLSAFFQTNSGHPEAPYAALLCGNAYSNLGRTEEARRFYRSALEKSSRREDIRSAAQEGLAALEEAEDRFLEAARLYAEQAAGEEDQQRRNHLLLAAVRCYRTGGAVEAAADLLEKIDPNPLDPVDQAGLEWERVEVELAMESREAGASPTEEP